MLIGIGIFLLGSTALRRGAEYGSDDRLSAPSRDSAAARFMRSRSSSSACSFPPTNARKMQGIISGIWGIASILGPLAGGIIVEYANWRWIFFVNLPLIAIATALIVIGLKEEQSEQRRPKLDFTGRGTLLLGLLLIFYALAQSAHARHPLNAETLAFIAAGLVVLASFSISSNGAPKSRLSRSIFSHRSLQILRCVATLCAMGVFGAISYLPLYLQGVLGIAASRQVWCCWCSVWVGLSGSLVAGRGINSIGYRFVGATGMVLLMLRLC